MQAFCSLRIIFVRIVMQLEVFDNMAMATEAEVKRMLPLVSDQRQMQALRFKFISGRFACLKTFLMLKSLVENQLQHTITPDSMTFGYNEHGKPYLLNYPDIHFSISHCKSALIVTIHDEEIGVDIESIRPLNKDLAAYVMNDSELKTIMSSTQPEASFTSLWTKKEAFLKYLGTGINNNLKDTLSKCNCHLQTIETTDYIYTIATK